MFEIKNNIWESLNYQSKSVNLEVESSEIKIRIEGLSRKIKNLKKEELSEDQELVLNLLKFRLRQMKYDLQCTVDKLNSTMWLTTRKGTAILLGITISSALLQVFFLQEKKIFINLLNSTIVPISIIAGTAAYHYRSKIINQRACKISIVEISYEISQIDSCVRKYGLLRKN